MRGNHPVSPGKRFAVENLDVFWVAIDFLRLLDPLGPVLWRRNSGLWDHLKRATASVLSNVAEAASTLNVNERRRFFEFAYRSAGECAGMIISFDAIGALTPEQIEPARALLHRIQMMLLRLIQKDRRPARPRPP
ncbi:MAG: four helix bundle protein [Gemmatimonadetes bacterium]|nr:four helix bundle protein [Gemmatimonadota bacterium]